MLPKIKHKPKIRKIFFPEDLNSSTLANNKNTQTEILIKKDCCICLQEFTPSCEQPNVSITKCHHFFCTSCLIKTMKYGNKCPLCRTILRSPTERLTMTPTLSNTIVQQELLFYDDYIKESFNYIIDMIHYYTTEKKMTQSVLIDIHSEMKKVFQNFGMGICYNVNRSLDELYRNQYQGEQTQGNTEVQTSQSNIVSPLEELTQLSNSGSYPSMSNPNILASFERLIPSQENPPRNSSPFAFPPI